MEGEVGGALLHLGVVGVASRLVRGQQRLQTAQVTQHLQQTADTLNKREE